MTKTQHRHDDNDDNQEQRYLYLALKIIERALHDAKTPGGQATTGTELLDILGQDGAEELLFYLRRIIHLTLELEADR